jgi:hypothetical protein
MSSEGKYTVLWSPSHEDKFLRVFNDLQFYKVEPLKDLSKNEGWLLVYFNYFVINM